MYTRPRATARRWVASLGVTSTMRARPSGSRWVSPRSDMAGKCRAACWALAADLGHGATGADELHGVDAVAGPLRPDAALDRRRQVVVARGPAQQRAQVVLVQGEEARAQLAVRRQAHPVTRRAERIGDAGDHADLAAAVSVDEALGRLAPPVAV